MYLFILRVNPIPCFLSYVFVFFHIIRDETAMTTNQAQGIIEYMPTLAEQNSLRSYMKDSSGNKGGESPESSSSAAKAFERLCKCKKVMVAMMTVKQSKRKIRALLFKLQFRGCIHDLAHGERNQAAHVHVHSTL